MLANPAHFDTTEHVLSALFRSDGEVVLAVIAGIEGPSYRPVGAMMAVLGEGETIGTLSSGCVESDIALNAQTARREGRPKMVRYGRGSEFLDIQLPCGGALDVLLLPNPDRAALKAAAEFRARRKPSVLSIELETGKLAVAEGRQVENATSTLQVVIEPEIRFCVFGKGTEASAFSSLAQSVGYQTTLFSPDVDTRNGAEAAGCSVHDLNKPEFPTGLEADYRTAVVLFFHDHDWEPGILAGALETAAFYIGAQGSMGARGTRDQALLELGVEQSSLKRLLGPIGLIPSVRDPRTLAVSVLAEVLDKARETSR